MAERAPERGELTCRVVARTPDERVLRVIGEVDLATAPRLTGFLLEELAAAPPGSSVRVDLAGTGFFSAAGVRALVVAAELARRRGVALVVDPVSATAALVLAACGIGVAAGTGTG
jgi:anti-sigma B factor antagonist